MNLGGKAVGRQYNNLCLACRGCSLCWRFGIGVLENPSHRIQLAAVNACRDAGRMEGIDCKALRLAPFISFLGEEVDEMEFSGITPVAARFSPSKLSSPGKQGPGDSSHYADAPEATLLSSESGSCNR